MSSTKAQLPTPTRILIVEDDGFYAQYMDEMLRDEGVQVTKASTAEEALALDAQSFDGAVIDVMLPNVSTTGITTEESRGGFATGVAVARRLLQKNSKLRVVLLSSDVVGGEAETWAASKSVPFVKKSEGSGALVRALASLGLLGGYRTPLAFIVHGHDETAVLELKNYIQNTLKWHEPTVLREQPSLGKTIIEKFEHHGGRIDCVFVLLTPDDRVIGDTDDEKRRSRQNVIFELGFFYGSLGRLSGRIIVLHKEPIELPSDLSGIVWIDIGGGVASAGEAIRKEVAGITGAAS